MTFKELKPKWLKIIDSKTFNFTGPLEGCDGVMFLCPTCFKKKGGPVGTHSIICWKPHVPLSEHFTGPGRWKLVGASEDDISMVGEPLSSVLLQGGCDAHFTVSNGQIIFH